MRRRVVAAMTIVVTLAVLLFALPLGVALDRRQRDQDRRELTQVAALAASRVQADRLGPSLRPRHLESEQRIGLYDVGGRRIDGSGPPNVESAIRPALADHLVQLRTGGNLVTAVPVVDARGVRTVVRASEPLASGRARVHGLWLWLGALALLTSAIGALVGVALSRRLTGPLADLVGDAVRIGDGDFTASARRTGLREVDQVADALTATAARLSEVIAREQAFTADASHQLRSPLTALRVTVEGELTHPRPNPAEALGEALIDIERLEQTIDDFLAFTRDVSPQRDPVDLARTIELLSRQWSGVLEAGRRSLVSEGGADIPQVPVSATAVSHVLDVLLSNAEAHGAGDVVVAARAHHGAVSVTVADHGAGIAEPSRLFVRRQPGARGNGIGLALARRLAEAEGGRLVLKHNGPPATVFELTLPAQSPAPPAARLPDPVRP